MPEALVIGAGPAGLMAAEELALSGVRVTVCEAKPSVGRKLLMAGKSGLNVTKDEPLAAFVTRERAPGWLPPAGGCGCIWRLFPSDAPGAAAAHPWWSRYTNCRLRSGAYRHTRPFSHPLFCHFNMPSPLPQDIGISLPVIKAAIIVGKKVLDAAESQFQAMESPASGGKHPRQAGGPSRCYRKGSGGHRRPGLALSRRPANTD